ncbi:HET-domain-containing protein [Nemania sp. FL0031]|nr:HET-domain-containing protein [Nemania sp. FL0031]
MWLINVKSYHLKEFIGRKPSYAILSHTWDEDEVTFQEMADEKGKNKKGYRKIQLTCEQAIRDNLDWAWVDTCCIDKKSSAELSEAINSMFQWYEDATVCYTYLADVEFTSPHLISDYLTLCRWIVRGWTLQELLAPRDMVFYDSHWTMIGSKFDLSETLSSITHIKPGYIETVLPLSDATVAEKMSWAAGRTTTREEDSAYSLIGIFGISMPLLYGEGGCRAFVRLQEQILNTRYDPTMFGSYLNPDSDASLPIRTDKYEKPTLCDLFAERVSQFRDQADLEITPDWPTLSESSPSVEGGALRITVPVIDLGPSAYASEIETKQPAILALFGIRWRSPDPHTLGIILRRWADNLYCINLGETRYVRMKVPDPDFLRSHMKTIRVRKPPIPNVLTQLEIHLEKELLELPAGFKLQTIVLVPPTTYDTQNGWLFKLSERDRPMFMLIFSNAHGRRFALLFSRDRDNSEHSGLEIQPMFLHPPANANHRNAGDSIYCAPADMISDQKSASSRGDDQIGYMPLEVVRVFQHKLDSYIKAIRRIEAPKYRNVYFYGAEVRIELDEGIRIAVQGQLTKARRLDDHLITNRSISWSLKSMYGEDEDYYWRMSES